MTRLQGEHCGRMGLVRLRLYRFNDSKFSSDYRHGTGHGVGHFLNVHEGPQGLGKRITYNDSELKPGMTLSNGLNELLPHLPELTCFYRAGLLC